MVVLLHGRIARGPKIAFKLRNHIHTARKNIQIPLAVTLLQKCLHARNARKNVLVHPCVDKYIPLAEQLCNAFTACKRPLPRRAVNQRGKPPPSVRFPAQLPAYFLNRTRVIVNIPAACKMLRNNVNIPVPVHAVPVRGKRVIQSGVNRNIVLPLLGHVKGRYNVHAFVKFGVNQPRPLGKFTVLPCVQRGGGKRGLKLLYLRLGQKRIVLPIHKLVPYLGVVFCVQINFPENERPPFKRRHRPENIPSPVHNAH